MIIMKLLYHVSVAATLLTMQTSHALPATSIVKGSAQTTLQSGKSIQHSDDE